MIQQCAAYCYLLSPFVVVIGAVVVIVVVVNLVVVSPAVWVCIGEFDTSDVNGWFDVDTAVLLRSVDNITSPLVVTVEDVVSAASEVTALSAPVLFSVPSAPASTGSFSGRRQSRTLLK